jgi:hypothetical protein
MAGAFTHMAIVSEAIRPFTADKKFGSILRTNLNFLTLGSVSPDIPYLAYLALAGFTWADVMHYHQTNGIVHNALHSLLAAKTRAKEWNCELAWLCGFVGHLVTDASIHPIVESIVGPYTDKGTRANHSECEMVQDVMIFKEVKNLELSAAEYTDHLQSCLEHTSFEAVSEFWSSLAKINCPAAGSLSVKNVLDSYFRLLDTAEGGNALAGAFRHLGFKYVYRRYQELKKNSPDLVNKYYSSIVLPNGLTGSFRKDGVDYTVKNLIAVWSKLDRALFSTENIVDIVPNWNLDTGIDQTTGKRTYWS